MKLSVIIVNYNVKHFLELCLQSTIKAIENIDAEIIIVDNNSLDGSKEYFSSNFESINYIYLEKNVGFSKANNVGVEKAKGEFVLFLNPDTVLQEDTLQKCLDFFESRKNVGGLGIKMIDGSGNFLPESKRALPNPEVAFYKIFGFANLFPKSKKFGKYHLTYLSKEENNEVDVLSGAFLMTKKAILNDIGSFDETFFMYGEDIDLSYRIQKGGFKNYYFAENSIIHFKGESTKKGSLNYVKMFYNAMSIFSKKHFKNSSASLFNLLIQVAIVLRAFLDIIVNFLKLLWVPILDAIFIIFGFVFMKNIYQNSFSAQANFSYPEELILINLPLYLVIWLASIYFLGGYDKPLKIKNLLRGVFVGFIIIAATYGFLPEQYRFSRALLLLGTSSTLLLTLANRYFLNYISPGNFEFDKDVKKRIAIVSDLNSAEEIVKLYSLAANNFEYAGFINDQNDSLTNKNYLGNFADFESIIKAYQIEEIVFDSNHLSYQKIIKSIDALDKKVSFGFYQAKSKSIVSSDSKNIAGNLLNENGNFRILNSGQKRNKRVFDFFLCVLLILFFPILLFYFKNFKTFLNNWFKVLKGKYSWIGYDNLSFQNNLYKLPKVKNGIIDLSNLKTEANLEHYNERLCFLYAKNYHLKNDFKWLMKNFALLDF